MDDSKAEGLELLRKALAIAKAEQMGVAAYLIDLAIQEFAVPFETIDPILHRPRT